MRQQNLFEEAAMQESPRTTYDLYGGTPPHSDNDTSLAAAVDITPHVSRLASQVLDFIRSRGAFGATCWECEQETGLSHQTVSARCRELVLKNLICDSSQRRNTGSGRKAVVWVESK